MLLFARCLSALLDCTLAVISPSGLRALTDNHLHLSRYKQLQGGGKNYKYNVAGDTTQANYLIGQHFWRAECLIIIFA